MTSLATIIGMIPMALKLGTGAEQYAPMARAIIGGLTSSVLLDNLHRAGGLSAGLWEARGEERSEPDAGDSGMKKVLLILLALVMPAYSLAQGGNGLGRTSPSLPSAPVAQQVPPADTSSLPMVGPQNTAAQNNPGTPTMLSLKDAQALALKNNPQISVARLSALATQQVTREVRSNLWPTATVDLTAVDSEPGSRITAGALNNPTVYPRAAAARW